MTMTNVQQNVASEIQSLATELPGGVNLVECFLYYDIPTEDKQP